MKITILGSGTSIGVPMPTCTCPTCQSHDPHDVRLRCSALVETDEGQQILIDCGPDMRYQSLRAHIRHLDALLLTHNHFDHCYGLDDLRPWAFAQPLPTYADTLMSDALLSRWDYIFVHRYPGVPQLELHTLCPDVNAQAARHHLQVADPEAWKASHIAQGEHGKYTDIPPFSAPLDGTGGADATFMVGATRCQAIRCFHGALPMLGYRIGRLAYLTDCTLIPEVEYAKLQGVEILVIDALRWKQHPTHFSVEQALQVVQRLQPRQTFFTHMSHDIGLHADFPRRLRQELGDRFPATLLDTVHLAYDQMELAF